MHAHSLLAAVAAAVAPVAVSALPSTQKIETYGVDRPSLTVYACPQVAEVTYSQSVPDKGPFPATEVGLCYDQDLGFLHINFTAYGETAFYFDDQQGTNDPIWQYEVMEAFIYKGTNDPQTYLEFEVSPNNITWQAFVYNPSKVRAAGAPFDTLYVKDPFGDGIAAQTTLDVPAQTWTSSVQIPLGLFNVDQGAAQGTQWRMNFFRTITSPDTFPNQTLGAWNPPDEASFHMTPFFGDVYFE